VQLPSAGRLPAWLRSPPGRPLRFERVGLPATTWVAWLCARGLGDGGGIPPRSALRAGRLPASPRRSVMIVAGFRHRCVTGRSAGELPGRCFCLDRRGRHGAALRTTGTRGTACGTW